MVYWRKGDYQQAESLFLSSLKIGTENNFTEIISACYNNLGMMDEAFKWVEKGSLSINALVLSVLVVINVSLLSFC